MKAEAMEMQSRLDELLSTPPRVVYRDRIVEIPSIETGTCEEVVVDIAAYLSNLVRKRTDPWAVFTGGGNEVP